MTICMICWHFSTLPSQGNVAWSICIYVVSKVFPVFCFAFLCFPSQNLGSEQAQEVAPEIIGREELQQPTTVDGTAPGVLRFDPTAV